MQVSDTAAAAGPTALTLAPLDVPLIIEVGRAINPQVVADACRGWEGKPSPQNPQIAICLDSAPHLSGKGDERISIFGPVIEMRGPGVFANVNLTRRSVDCLVSADYLTDLRRLRESVLEPLVLMLVTRCDRAPVHASAFIARGLAILLAGRSGSGKSCLARAADTAGYQLLSDDTVYVQTSPSLRVWGWPTAAHLLPKDTADDGWPTRVRNAKTKYVVPLRSASMAAIRCERAALCVLDRGEKAELSRITAAEALDHLWPLDPGFDLLPDEIRGAIGILTARGAWKLRLSSDPDEAIRLLQASLAQLEETAAGEN